MMWPRSLTRLSRHVSAVKPYNKHNRVRTFADRASEPEQTVQKSMSTRPSRDGSAMQTITNAFSKPHYIDGRWLRDQCACAECRNVETAQRKINVLKNPAAGKITASNEIENAGEDHAEGSSFQVTFGDGHISIFPSKVFEWRVRRRGSHLRDLTPEIEHWQATISADPPTVEYEDIQTGNGMGNLLAKIATSGFCFVDNMPATPEASQALLEQIGPIRNTHYGGFYDFTSDLSSKDTAYTSESLEPHTDTTYFTEPIGLQALHLLSHTDGEGGLSSLVDGFSAARELFEQDESAYVKLSTTRVWAHASGNEGISIQPASDFTVLKHLRWDKWDWERTKDSLSQVCWNTADRTDVEASHRPEGQKSWYDAATAFDKIISKPENQYWFQLKPGKMLIFDNWRVLHGRSAFTGKRRMCGGYINRDDWISKYRMTNFSKEKVMAATFVG